MSRPAIRLLRALWRYRGRIGAHGREYQVEVATTVRSTLRSNVAGRASLATYRWAMRALLAVAVSLGLLAVVAAYLLWRAEHWTVVFALVAAVPAALLGWWWTTWGAALRWLDEFADPHRMTSVVELPARLRELAARSRAMADVPARVADELDALADETATGSPAPASQ